jgi:UDP-glucose 4-epimerase
VTGGAGYIGSHVVHALRASGREVVVLDDLSTGSPSRVPDEVDLVQASVLDTEGLTSLLSRSRCTGVVHVAGKKSPTESLVDPLSYARENAGGVISVAQAVKAAGARRIVFSSSCSVYGNPVDDWVTEDQPTVPVSPYGESKLYGEQVLRAAARAHGLGLVNLRYFNVIGARGPAMRDTGAYNLLPLLFAALRAGRPVQVFGTDYPTPDGTCVRDYLDVRDLADAHVRAAVALEEGPQVLTLNVGRGEGSSVLQLLATVESVTGSPVPVEMAPRRPGDPGRIVGKVDRIRATLGWTASRDVASSVRSAWEAETVTVPRTAT